MTPLLIAAGNASEWTGPTGNNTWLIPGVEPTLVDAGIGNSHHIDAIGEALAGRTLTRVLITHSHVDHVAGLPALRERWPDLEIFPGRSGLPAVVNAGDGELDVIPTPGHAPDHVCYLDRVSGDLFCGDLARIGGTVVIPARSGGDLRAYLDSLRRVRDLRPRRLLPGHGPIVADPLRLIDEYIAHRARRERQIVEAMRAGARTPEDLVARIYPGIPDGLRQAAIETVEAHLTKLQSDS